MNLNGLTCRAYLGLRELKIVKILRRIPGVRRPAQRLLKVLLPSEPVWVQVRSGMSQGMWMRLSLQDEARLWRGDHEPTLQGALRAAVLPGTVVYDIGAHMGSIALGVARLVGPKGHVVAFEADRRNAETLRDNRDRNQSSWNSSNRFFRSVVLFLQQYFLSQRRREEGTRRRRDGRPAPGSWKRTVD